MFMLADVHGQGRLRVHEELERSLMTGDRPREIGRLILTNKLEPNINDKLLHDGRSTVLGLAASHGHVEVVKVLVNVFGANVETTNIKGETPLLLAAKNDRLEVVQCLVGEFNADVYARDRAGISILGKANAGEFRVCGEYLVTRKPTRNFSDNLDEKTYKQLKTLAKTLDVNVHNMNKDQIIAAIRGSDGETRRFQRDINEHAPPSASVMSSVPSSAKYKQSAPNITSEAMYDVERSLLFEDNPRLVRDFIIERRLRHTINGYLVQRKNETILFMAANYGRVEVARMLVDEFAANVEKGDKWDKTPLMSAARNGNERVVRYLVDECEANVFATDDRGKSVIEFAREGGILAVEAFLEAKLPEDQRLLNKMNDTAQRNMQTELEAAEEKFSVQPVIMGATRGPFKMLQDRDAVAHFERKLATLQPRTYAVEMSKEFLRDYARTGREFDRILTLLRQIYEAEKTRLLQDDAYFESMVAMKNRPEFRRFLASQSRYRGAWEDASSSPSWNSDLREIMTIADQYTHSGPQPIDSFVEIYPVCVVAQNRVDVIVGELADQTHASEGMYLSGVKSLFRAFTKAAFSVNHPYKTRLWDWARGLISYPDLPSIKGAIERLLNKTLFPKVEVKNIHVTFKEVGQDSESWFTAWQDVKVHFVFTDADPQLICELQLCLNDFTNTRRGMGGHQQYAKFRMVMEAERWVLANRN